MDNREEMDKFLEMYNLPRLNREEEEYTHTHTNTHTHTHRLITSSETELVTEKTNKKTQ